MPTLYLSDFFSNGYGYGMSVYKTLNQFEKSVVHDQGFFQEDVGKSITQSVLNSIRVSRVKLIVNATPRLSVSNYDVIFETARLLANAPDLISDVFACCDATPNDNFNIFNTLVEPPFNLITLPCASWDGPLHTLKDLAIRHNVLGVSTGLMPATKATYEKLQQVWACFQNDDGDPNKTLVYGFKINDLKLLTQFPWHAVCTNLWLKIAMLGSIVTSAVTDIAVADGHSKAKTVGGHIDTVSAIEKEMLISQVEALGFDYNRIRTNVHTRALYNIVNLQSMLSKNA